MQQYLVPLRHAVLGLVVLAACRPAGAPSEPASTAPARVENPALGLAIAELPDGWVVTENRGETFRFARHKGLPPGDAWIEVGPPVDAGINLIEVIRGQREAFEALPGGSFSGNGELQLPDGRPAYYSRGRFDDNGQKVEEFRFWLVHPGANNRLLQIFYRYPAAEDSKQRLEDMLYLVGEIEALSTSGAEPTAPGGEIHDP